MTMENVIYSLFVLLLSFGSTYAVSMFMLCRLHEKRRCFAVKSIVYLVLLLGLSVLSGMAYFVSKFPNLQQLETFAHALENQWKIPVLLVEVVTIVVCNYLLYVMTWKELLFFSTSAYLIQHVPVTIYSTMIAGGIAKNVYLFFAIYVVVYLLAYFVVIKRIRKKEVSISGANLVVSSLLAALVILAFEFASKFNMGVAAGLYQILSCLLMIMVAFGFFRESNIEKEKVQLQYYLQGEQKHYEDLCESMKLVNIKCHDLKYALTEDTSDKTYKQEATAVVEMYDNLDLTDCEPLNVVIADKNLLCEKYGIKLYCIADGKALRFMQPQDIFIMFGNALDNAIEYLRQVDDVGKRLIYLRVNTVNEMSVVNIENYYDGELRFDENNEIETSKSDKANHGWGLKSIRYIVEKYNGTVSVNVDNNAFVVTAIFPAN